MRPTRRRWSSPLAFALAVSLAAVGAAPGCHHQAASKPCAGPPMVDPVGPPVDPATPVARLDGETITQGELDAYLGGGLVRARNEYLAGVHKMRADGLDSLLVGRLVARKAAAAKLTPDEFVKREVLDKAAPATDEELKQIYDAAVAQGETLPPFEEVKPQLRDYVRKEQEKALLKEYGDGLLAEAKVERLLPPLALPRADVAGQGPAKGPADAKVTVVEFSDYQCPFCRRAEDTVARLLSEYDGKVRLVFRQYPLPMHPNAQKASEAALCAEAQGKFWDMHRKLYENQDALELDKLKAYAREVGLDGARFDRCLDSGEMAKAVDADRKAGDAAGVTGTPSFFVNGRPGVAGADYDELKALVDYELRAAE